MKPRWIALGLLLLVCIVAAPGLSRSTAIPQATLQRALESGCSFVIAEILSVRAENNGYRCKAKVVRTIVAGDLDKADVQKRWEFVIGPRYVTVLKPGSQYAMFFRRDCPYDLAWAFADDLIEVDPSDKDAIRQLVETADPVYAGTTIRQFRRAMTLAYSKPSATPDVPSGLSGELVLLCKQFREGPGRRTGLGKQIAESDLGSRRDVSDIESSIPKYLPPKIPLSRRQVRTLLGWPTWRSGWTYSWQCDDFVHAQEGGSEIGILSATFDGNEMAVRVLFEMQERSKWIRPAKPSDWFAELDGEPGGVARQFLEALKQSDWDRALSVCSERVKAKALRAAAADVFFRDYVPVEKLAALSQFQPRGYASREGRIGKVSAEADVKPGPLPGIEQIIERLLPVLPAGWRFTRHAVSQSDDIDAPSFGQLYIHLIGQRGGKGGDRGVLLVILPGSDASETDPWLKESLDFWGLSPRGLVYASVNDVDSLWPDHRTRIMRVLEIKPPQGP